MRLTMLISRSVSRDSRPVPRRGRPSIEALEHRPLLTSFVAGYDVPGTTNYPNAALERIGEVILNPGEHTFYTGVVDPLHGYGYFGTTGSGTAYVVKVALGTNGAPPTRVASIAMPSGEGYLLSSVIDPANGYVYFGASDGIIKVALGAGDAPPTRVGLLPLNPGESNLFGAVGDTANGYAYFEATLNGQEEVIKVALGAGNALPTRVGSAILGPGNGWRALIDPANGYAYFTTSFTTNPATIYKVALGAGGAPPSLVGTLTLNASDGALVAAAIDPLNGYAYYAGTHYNAQFVITSEDIVKVALGAGNAAPTRIGAIAIPAHSYTSMLLDSSAGYATLSDDVTVPASDVIKVTLGAGNALPTVVGQIQLRVGSNPPVPPAQANEPQAGEVYVRSGGYDPGTGEDYFGTDSYPAQVIKVRTSLEGAIEGTKIVLGQSAAVNDVRFYSQSAAGDLRLAIYDSGGNLVWQSGSIADTVANGWISAPVPPGTLTLGPGTYWLAFQTDSTANVAGDTPGNPGDGFEMLQDYGAFAPTLANVQTNANDWSLALDYATSPPTLGAITDFSMSSYPSTQAVTLQGADPDGDTLAYAAQAQTLPYFIEHTYGVYEDARGLFANFRGQGEIYLRGMVSANNINNGGGDFWYYILPDGDFYEFTANYGDPALVGTLVAHLGVAYYDDPTLLTDASSSPPPVTLSVAGNELTIAPASGYAGRFVVIAGVSDGQAGSSKSFKVTVS